MARPMAGLGISFGSTGFNSVAQNVYADSSVSSARPVKPLPRRSTQEDVEMSDPSPSCDAYSQCPSQEFAAPSPPSLHVAPAYYSPCDNFLMLVDSPALHEIKMEVDSPALVTKEPRMESNLYRFLTSPDASTVGIIPDVNFRALAAQQQCAPVLCVNPADISGPGPGLELPPTKVEDEDIVMASPEAPAQPGTTTATADFPEEAVSAIVSVLAASVKRQEAEEELVVPGSMPVVRGGGYASHPLTSVQLPAFAVRSVVPSSETVGRTPLGLQNVSTPLQETALMWAANQMSPILNAHEGIDLDRLRQKADNWRKLNPGFELDKTFLQSFAGRLSEKGELIPYYRCYVNGCAQSNKRRDHILVHVGSHVEHRPFQCDTCGMRFLRKNECKRHMSSHAGFKPYSCTICPAFLGKNFVRQDLLKRHMRVSHGVVSENSRPCTSAGSGGRIGRRVFKRGESLSPISEYQP
ncbi:hypothetical protein BDY19DRAFT_944932 [Irpex rosettiformis]|uniref:Uncharacterized protein n=1 Tax=Irpex rosettiformis TaxID=378272 RepID=A0ACB8U581_9APHY|nr:hypothetical protein BDY19DRAFT_944932 [Irpex rosettiformis]